ncbi:2-methylcitrate synthase, partial [candidate division KSB1 bacterium]|nr:2-methylcitrate synthase [candidate division KSB1 bacterium]
TTAIGTLKGKLHGGANEAAMEMILPLKDEAEAESFIDQALKNKVKIMGFGHRVYKISDPRSDIVKEMTRKLSERLGDWRYYKISEVIEKKLRDEKKLFPNADFYSASFYYLLGIPIHLYTPIFVFSRTAGWCAHVLEQRANNRLIRPTAEYTGPGPQDWVPRDKR